MTKWRKLILLLVMARSDLLIEKEMSQGVFCEVSRRESLTFPQQGFAFLTKPGISKERLAKNTARFWWKCWIGIQFVVSQCERDQWESNNFSSCAAEEHSLSRLHLCLHLVYTLLRSYLLLCSLTLTHFHLLMSNFQQVERQWASASADWPLLGWVKTWKMSSLTYSKG